MCRVFIVRRADRSPRAPLVALRVACLIGAVALASGLAGATLHGQAPPTPALYEPGISPDGSEIAFVAGGDVWTVPVAGGDARLLVSHSTPESRPLYSPDGGRLAFNSGRDGSRDVHVLDLASGAVRRLTRHSGSEYLEGWSRDGEWIYFSSSREDVGGRRDVFRVRASGGTSMAVAGDRYEGEFFAAPGPDGLLALGTRGNMAASQWWRNGHAHIDMAEIWLVREGETPSYARFATGGKNAWPMWTPDGSTLVWVSDRSGTENLWLAPREGGDAERVTGFDDGRVLWPSMAARVPVVAFERDFGIWTWDARTGETAPVPVTLRGVSEAPRARTEERDDDVDDLVLSPDGEKVAFLTRGEVFAASAEEGGDAVRITWTPEAEEDPVWTGDSRGLVYVSRREGAPNLVHYNFGTREERALTEGDVSKGRPVLSPDGARVAYRRGDDEVRVLELEGGGDRLVARAPGLRGGPVWSPDGEWLALSGQATDMFPNVHVVPVSGGEPRPVSFLPHNNFGSLRWSPDGRFLLFTTSQRTEEGMLVRVDLMPEVPVVFEEDDFWDLFREEEPEPGELRSEASDTAEEEVGEAAGEGAEPGEVAVEIDFDGIRERARAVPVGLDVASVTISPDGETAVIVGSRGAGNRLWRYSLDPRDPGNREELASAAGGDLQFSADGRTLYYVRGGEIRRLALASGDEETVEVSAEVDVDFHADKRAAFEQAWYAMRDGFYDPEMHGVDWDAVRRDVEPRVAAARTPIEVSRLMNLMLGELDASHLGHRGGGGGGGAEATGELGVRFDRLAYEEDGAFRVAEILPLGPADVSDSIAPGDRLVSVDGVELDGSADLDGLLEGTVGDKVVVGVEREGGAEVRTVELKPVSGGQARSLRYRAWVESRRAYVDSVSDGRLGYVHIPDMGTSSLNQLYLDLDTENQRRDGVVVDVRDNNGGFVNVYAIDVFTRRNYFTMRSRGGLPMPSRFQLGQRALLTPTVLVTNQHTLSDGEDFTEGYRALELGPVVGEPTAGWIIYTGSVGLVDGTSIRMPRTEIRGSDGEVMERNPRPVDVEVEAPAGEWYAGTDIQLDAAVAALLERLADRTTDGGSS